MYLLAFQECKSGLKAVLIQQGKSPKIELVRSFEKSDVNPFYMLKPLLEKKKIRIVTGLEAWDILLREIELKITKQSALEQALPFQLEAVIPYPLEEAIVLPFFKKMDAKTTVATIYSTKRLSLEKHLEDFKNRGIDPDQVSCIPSALVSFAKATAPEYSDLIIFHVGDDKSTCVALVGGRLALSLNVNNNKGELQRMVAYLKQKVPCTHFLLTGESPELIKESLGEEFTFVTPALQGWETELLQNYAIPIGLALENNEVNFRAGSYAPPKKMKERRKLISSYLTASLGLCALLFFGTQKMISDKENRLKERLEQVARISDADLASDLDTWEKTMKSKKPSASYSLTVPKVSDVLAWISSHPKLEKLDVTRIQYSLVRFPKIGKEQEPYEAKVEIEFTAPSPRLAREFHDHLTAGGGLVDTKQPITWNASQDHYTASFFLNRAATP